MIIFSRLKLFIGLYTILLLLLLSTFHPPRVLAAETDSTSPTISVEDVTPNTQKTMYSVSGIVSDNMTTSENIKMEFIDETKQSTTITPETNGNWTINV